eukprot:6486771-Amphidinium_carterae.1
MYPSLVVEIGVRLLSGWLSKSVVNVSCPPCPTIECPDCLCELHIGSQIEWILNLLLGPICFVCGWYCRGAFVVREKRCRAQKPESATEEEDGDTEELGVRAVRGTGAVASAARVGARAKRGVIG